MKKTLKKTLHLSRLSFAIAAGLLLLPATGADSTRVGGYDFSYASAGDTRARPVQVFDDGRSTFFQFRAGEAVPAIFAQQGGVPQLLVPTQEGPYIRVAEVHGRFVLQVGRAQANVVHAGGTRVDAPPVNVVTPTGLATPYAGGTVGEGSRLVASLSPIGLGNVIDDAAHRNSYATPTKGDAVTWVAPEPKRAEFEVLFAKGSAVLTPEGRKVIASVAKMDGAQSRIRVIGRDDESLKEGLDRLRADTLKNALVKAGADPTRVLTSVGIAGKPLGARWPSTLQVETERPAPAGTNSDSPRLATIRSNLEALVRAGVLRPDQAQAIAVQHGAKPTAVLAAPAATGFTLTASDKTLQNSLRRWAQQSNYQLVWDAPAALDAPILGDASIPGATIQDALQRLLLGLKEKGYALDATVFSNRVIRLTAAAGARPTADSVAPTTAPATPAASAPSRVEPKPAPARGSLAQGAQWQMLQGDRTVQNMLSRWATDAQGSVVWNAGEPVAIVGDAVIKSTSLRGAAEQVIAQAAAAGYRLRMTSTDERTLVVSSY